MGFDYKQFKHTNLNDPFFDSLKADYAEFEDWFGRKAENWAYVFEQQDTGEIDGFLYLKVEDGAVDDVNPPLPEKRRIKVGTFKINAHGTKLGERFVKKIFDHAIQEKAEELYVTVFEKHAGLIALLTKYGFETVATKATDNGVENVMIRSMVWDDYAGREKNYPLIKLDGSYYQVGIHPGYHTRLLPDSILNNEDVNIVRDISHTNSINKIYIAAMQGLMGLRPGDKIVMYRTGDGQGPAEYRAVATSLCVVEEVRHLDSFPTEGDFVNYARPHSVFPDDELRGFYRSRRYPFIVRFTYNIALRRRLTRHHLIESIGISRDAYPGFLRLTVEQFKAIARDGGVDESLIVD
ncbi:N-acetyltransferase [Burkholderia gladioli]|uniref:N-acetyltransferase n=1 Tax=Burkholderia gladioli TaxID=28095 RepID=UPI000CDB74C0|nr:N-acetyltransferase [Burkholderia gladioli]POS05298.1 N-acetyltransferase [Burkholderia gladioli]